MKFRRLIRSFHPLPLACAAWTLLWGLSVWIDVAGGPAVGARLILHSLVWAAGLSCVIHGGGLLGRALKAARAAERKYRLLFDSARDAIVVYPFEEDGSPGRFVEVNRAAAESLGYSREELLAMTPFDLDVQPEETKRRIADEQLRNGGLVFESLLRTRDGGVREVEVGARLFEMDGATMAMVVSRDLTERRESERRLRQSEARFRSLFERMLNGFTLHRIVLDEAGRPADFVFLEANASFERMTGLSREQVIGRRMTEVVPHIREADFDWIGEMGRVAVEGRELRTEVEAKSIGRWWSLAAYPQAEGCFAIVSEDVTDRKRAEEVLRRSLREKEARLREIHHRVKNNLQIVSSLLSLEAEKSGDPAALALFRESRDRVRAMALIHERLYRSGDLSGVDFGAFLREACAYLLRAYAPRDGAPRLDVEAADVLLEIDQAIPAGLIVNELVSNALKHAFPRDKDWPDPRVSTSLTLLASGEAVLVVADNGVGSSGPFAPEDGKTLGLLLVKTLARQLKGRLDVDGGRGMRVSVTFRPRSGRGDVEGEGVSAVGSQA